MSEREIFLGLLEIEESIAREQYLERACQGDQELRHRVETLWLSHASAGDFLLRPIVCPVDLMLDDPLANDNADGSETTQSEFELGSSSINISSLLGKLSPTSRSDSLGVLGHYEILEALGRGGFGTVFKAFDEKLQRFVAIKMMSDENAMTAAARQRFLREARSAAAIRHENVSAIYAVEEQPFPYLVMEFVPGRTLQELVDESGPLPSAQVAEIGKQIAQGLAAAHSRGLIHRDIKPSNILVEGGAHTHVKITDFGLARAVDDTSNSLSCVISGTPMYMSPEQAHGGTIDWRTDLFSLGSVLYFLTSGHPPFRAATTLAVMQQVAQVQPQPLEEVIIGIPRWMSSAIVKLLAKRPEDRFQSSEELLEAFSEQKFSACTEPTSPADSAARKLTRYLVVGRPKFFAIVGLALATCVSAWAYFGKHPVQKSEQLSGAKASKIPTPAIAVEPFDALQASEVQAQWASYLNVPLDYTNGIGMRFRLLPPGEFTMGTSQQELEVLLAQAKEENKPEWNIKNIATESPAHRVRLTHPLYVSIYETTVANFREMVDEDHYRVESIRDGQGGIWNGAEYSIELSWENPYKNTVAQDNEPVRQISWNDAVHFCEWLSAREKRSYRMLTEAEWEYSCRAGTTTSTYTGKRLLANQARFANLSIAEVGSYPANPWGLHDMLGNVSEWCFDQIENTYTNSATIDPVYLGGREDQERVIRGGAFYEPAPRSAQRRGGKRSFRADTIGFRVALEIENSL